MQGVSAVKIGHAADNESDAGSYALPKQKETSRRSQIMWENG